MVYKMLSPVSLTELLFKSLTDAVLVTFKILLAIISVTVGSFKVFPSVSSPSSLISPTSLVFPGLLPVTVTKLIIEPVSAAIKEIV